MGKIVVALGGNALGNSAEEQLKLAQQVSRSIVDLVLANNNLLLVHGNGPQVGQIRLAFEEASAGGKVPLAPFAECTAMSQGYIGYHLQQAIDEEFVERGYYNMPVVTMLTQVVVSANDPAFANPTKPIGGFFTEEQARELMAATGNLYREDSGRGWRRVVPSPKPIDIYEKITLRTLVQANEVVITCGGGGIPVVYKGSRYHGVDAVIDKDFTSAKLAHLVDADTLLILTAVDRVCINFNTPAQKELDRISVEDARRYIAEGQFPAGSMLPKVEAALDFVSAARGRRAIIGSLEKAREALDGASGTAIVS